MDNSDLDWAGGGIEEVLPDVEEVGALPPHPHWGGSTPRPLLAAHSTTRREKGFRTSTPSAFGRKTGGALLAPLTAAFGGRMLSIH